MKEQTLITSNSRLEWQRDVNRHFGMGWQIVPGTLIICTAAASTHRRSSSYLDIDSVSEFAVVLEREISDAE